MSNNNSRIKAVAVAAALVMVVGACASTRSGPSVPEETEAGLRAHFATAIAAVADRDFGWLAAHDGCAGSTGADIAGDFAMVEAFTGLKLDDIAGDLVVEVIDFNLGATSFVSTSFVEGSEAAEMWGNFGSEGDTESLRFVDGDWQTLDTDCGA